MRVLIATPAYGGQITTTYLRSLLETTEKLRADGIEHHVYTLSNESLIPRGRNNCAKIAIEGEFTDLFFLDADLGWNYEMFKKVLHSKYDICGGTYPVKRLPITMNFNAFTKDRMEAEISGPMNEENYGKFIKACADEDGEIEVAHVPTGFLRIKVSVLNKLLERDPNEYGIDRYSKLGSVCYTKQSMYDFFKIGVRGDEYLSEDWFFCEHARFEGFKIALQTDAICSHLGATEFYPDLKKIQGQDPLLQEGNAR